jgi:hypothetical protein
MEPNKGITEVEGGKRAPQKRIKRMPSDSALQTLPGERETEIATMHVL